jgi:hypothetical protein
MQPTHLLFTINGIQIPLSVIIILGLLLVFSILFLMAIFAPNYNEPEYTKCKFCYKKSKTKDLQIDPTLDCFRCPFCGNIVEIL